MGYKGKEERRKMDSKKYSKARETIARGDFS